MILLSGAYIVLLIGVADGAGDAVRLLSANFLIGLLFLLPILALIAQFVLPVREAGGRRAVVGRLFNYLLGERGTVTFIKDGEPQAAADERSLRGAGVLWADHLSAALLRTDSALTRVVGPGELAFTESGEWLAEGFDLRRQQRALRGAAPPTGTAATEAEVSSMALTRDGIPVSASLAVTFLLERRTPIKSGAIADPPPILPSMGAVQNAAYGKMISPDRDLKWSDIPLKAVVELWRDEVKSRDLDTFVQDHSGVLESIQASLLSRLSASARSTEASASAIQMMRERGIRVLEVSISDVQVPEEIQAEQLQAWFDSWAGPVRRQLDESTEMVREAGIRGEREASLILIERLTQKIEQQLQLDQSLGQRDTLILLLEDAVQLCADHPRLVPLGTRIRDILDQVRARDSECQERDRKR